MKVIVQNHSRPLTHRVAHVLRNKGRTLRELYAQTIERGPNTAVVMAAVLPRRCVCLMKEIMKRKVAGVLYVSAPYLPEI